MENHSALIAELKKLIDANSEHNRTKLFLLDNLITDGRYKEAEELLADTKVVNTRIIYELWIKECRFGFEATRNDYEALLEAADLEWTVYADAADRLAYNMEYELAIKAYEKAHTTAPKPRYTDMLQSIIMLAGMLDNRELIVGTCKRELNVLAKEWNITKGEQVDALKETIRKYS